MKNKLFIICPFSQLETFLQKKYGENVYFITAPASIMDWNQKQYFDMLSDFIQSKKINELFVVNDVDCCFIESIIAKKKLQGLYSEKILEQLYVEHYFTHFKNETPEQQKIKLAELSINYQLMQLIQTQPLGLQIMDGDIELKGLITSKKENYFSEIQIHHLKNTSL